MEYIVVLLYKYGITAVCLVILIEYACFPVSSEVVLPFSGVIAYINDIDIRLLVILSVICGVMGSSICYVLGRRFGKQGINKLISKMPKSKKAFEKSEEFFEKFGNFAVMIARIIPLCRTYISFIAGAFKQPYGDFVLFSVIGITIWNTILITLGFFLGDNWGIVSQMYSKYKVIIVGFVVLVIFIVLAKRVMLKVVRKK